MNSIEEALQALCLLNEDKSKRLLRQNWLDYFQGAVFWEVHKQSEFLDALLEYMKNHDLEDWILKDFCRTFDIKQVASNHELRNSHEFYKYMVSLRERLLDKIEPMQIQSKSGSIMSIVFLHILIIICEIILIEPISELLNVGTVDTWLASVVGSVIFLTITSMFYNIIVFKKKRNEHVSYFLYAGVIGIPLMLFIVNIVFLTNFLY